MFLLKVLHALAVTTAKSVWLFHLEDATLLYFAIEVAYRVSEVVVIFVPYKSGVLKCLWLCVFM